jgi:hypothetical protein
MTEVKKDLTQGQVEGILKEQFRSAQMWEFTFLVLFFFVPPVLLGLAGITLPFWFKWALIAACIFAFWSCERWSIDRKVKHTIEKMRQA